MKQNPTSITSRYSIILMLILALAKLSAQSRLISDTIVVNGAQRSYLLYIPAAYDGSEKWPLVISIHGYAVDNAFQMSFTQMNVVADTEHFLLAYPQGTLMFSTVPGLPAQGLGWNVGLDTDTAMVSPTQVNDVAFIQQLIDSIGTAYNVAAERIYATGFSSGAAMCYVLACELGNKIAAIAPVSGTAPLNRLCFPTRPVPVLHIHDTEDEFSNYATGNIYLGKPVTTTIQFWVNQNHCAEQPVITGLPDLVSGDGTTVELHQWQNCEAEVMHFKILGGGHQWPGGMNILPILGNLSLDINASAEIWNFFKRQQLPTNAVHTLPSESYNIKVFPNPFSEQLYFNFELPKSAFVQLAVFNSLGSKCKFYTVGK
ncbi:MAG: alpha/beta hydrolase family esterase [Saprospiraceae bacterium]